MGAVVACLRISGQATYPMMTNNSLEILLYSTMIIIRYQRLGCQVDSMSNLQRAGRLR
jgi:hypothetical protein